MATMNADGTMNMNQSEYLTRYGFKMGTWPQGAVTAAVNSSGQIVAYRMTSGQEVKTQYAAAPPPPPPRDTSLGRDAVKTPEMIARERQAQIDAQNNSEYVRSGIGTTGGYSAVNCKPGDVRNTMGQCVPPPPPPPPLPPARDIPQAPPLPNLVKNQAAVNQALSKLAQADILVQRAKALGMQVDEVEKQIGELRQLLLNAQRHLMQ